MTSISAERSALARVGGGLIRREQWGARHDYRSARAVTEPAQQIFIHITVTNPSAYNSHAAHVRGIEAIGRSRFPNTGISYNRIVLFGVDRAYEGQPIGRRGAHTVNDHRRSTCNRWGAACPGHSGDLTAPSWNNNYVARAYAYGALTQHSVTDSVLDTFARAIADDIKAGFVRRDAKIHGHRCLSSKSCPGDHMWARMHDLERRVNDYLKGEVQEDDMFDPNKHIEDIAKAVRSEVLFYRNPYGQQVDGVDSEAPTLVQELGRMDRRTYRAQAERLDPAAIAAAVIAALPDGRLDQATAEAAFRNVLGSLDDA